MDGVIIIKLVSFFFFFCFICPFGKPATLFPQIVDDCHLRFAVTTKKMFFSLAPLEEHKWVGANTQSDKHRHTVFFLIYTYKG
jgi:hypothetical protein